MKKQITFIENQLGIKVHSIQSIYGGLNSNNYLVNQSLVFRFKLPAVDHFYQAQQEHAIEKAIQPFHLSPKLLYFNEETGHKATVYEPYATIFNKALLHEQWPAILSKIKILHQLTLPNIHAFDGLKRLQHYQFFSQEPDLMENQVKWLSEIQTIEQNYPFVLSHNDLVQGNMLFQHQSCWLIDYEYAGLNSFLFDYFSFISENQITNDHDVLWTQQWYFDTEPLLKPSHFHHYHAYVDLLWFYWAKAMHKQTQFAIYDLISQDKKRSFEFHYQTSKCC